MNGAPTSGKDPKSQPGTMDSLRQLLDRLVSPELTLPEARCLRSRIHQLLGEVNAEPQPASPWP